MTYRSLKSFRPDEPLAFELGNMVAAWAHAEQTLIHVLARASAVHINRCQVSYYRISNISSRMQFISSLVESWTTNDFDKLAIIAEIDGLSKLSATRNRWVHGDWCDNEDSSEFVIFDHRVAFDQPSKRNLVKASDVRNHNAAVLRRNDQLFYLIRGPELY